MSGPCCSSPHQLSSQDSWQRGPQFPKRKTTLHRCRVWPDGSKEMIPQESNISVSLKDVVLQRKITTQCWGWHGPCPLPSCFYVEKAPLWWCYCLLPHSLSRDRGVTYPISVPGEVQSVCLCDCLFAEVNIQEQDFTGRTLRWVSSAIVSEVVCLLNSGVKD